MSKKVVKHDRDQSITAPNAFFFATCTGDNFDEKHKAICRGCVYIDVYEVVKLLTLVNFKTSFATDMHTYLIIKCLI